MKKIILIGLYIFLILLVGCGDRVINIDCSDCKAINGSLICNYPNNKNWEIECSTNDCFMSEEVNLHWYQEDIRNGYDCVNIPQTASDEWLDACGFHYNNTKT